MNPKIFREYDIRGTYPEQINEREVFDIASRMKAIFPKGKKIVIGRDSRNSSPSLYLALHNGLSSAGFKVIGAGLIITPAVDFFVRRFNAYGGIVVTASHNPKNFNGLYIVDKKGESVGGQDIYSKIRNLNPKIKIPSGRYPEEKTDSNQKEYADFLSLRFSVEKPIRVVIDCSNGSAGPIIKKLGFPKNVIPILLNAGPDGDFPAHGPNPMAKGALNGAAAAVIKNKADLGIVFDGDGDRAFILDNLGREVIPEYVWKLIDSVYPQRKIVYSVLSAYAMAMLKSELPELKQLKLVEAKVGHLFMKQACFREKDAIGIETSMHYYMPWDNFAGSGILVMIVIINALSRMPYSLSDLVSMMPKIIRIPEYNIGMNKNKLPALYKNIHKTFLKESVKFSRRDGLSVFGNGWWLNVRPSNTEDLVRINIEAKEEVEAKKIKKIILSRIKK
jgi:phosphomannomutase